MSDVTNEKLLNFKFCLKYLIFQLHVFNLTIYCTKHIGLISRAQPGSEYYINAEFIKDKTHHLRFRLPRWISSIISLVCARVRHLWSFFSESSVNPGLARHCSFIDNEFVWLSLVSSGFFFHCECINSHKMHNNG